MSLFDNNAVRVALRIRPQSAREKAEQTAVCTSVVPGVPQIRIGDKRSYTFDFVFDQCSQQQDIYDACVRQLIDGTFDGYNATVLAYGQTGSGKTYTMGTSFESTSTDATTGIIPRAADHIFTKMTALRADARQQGSMEPQFELYVQFIELYNEEIHDLLAIEERRPGSTAIKIHEDPSNGEIFLNGVTSVQLTSAQAILDALQQGALNRTTASTNMNQQSSRSHAIFTIQIKQQRMVAVNSEDAQNLSINGNTAPLSEVEMLTAKFRFVDLAGSERLKRTGATGNRAKEGISINSGLLALGNVISVLGGACAQHHVPYRDSKLTRLLQDSLGGNSRTLMIACASPCDRDFVETLNTLNYANRAKNIKNKVVANQDKSSKLIGELRAQIAALEAELVEYRQGKRVFGAEGIEAMNDQCLENAILQREVNQLNIRVKTLYETNQNLQRRCVALMERIVLTKLDLPLDADPQQNGGTTISVRAAVCAYVRELEELRAKLDEERLINEELRKQNARFRTLAQERGSPYIGDGAASSMLAPVRSAEHTAALIRAAKRDISRHKRKVLAQKNNDETAKTEVTGEKESSADDDNGAETDGVDDERIDEDGIDSARMEKDDVDAEHDVNDQLEVTVLSIGRDRLCTDLAELQDDISIKEALVLELEAKERHLAIMRQNFERKLSELSERIAAVEAERNHIVSEMMAKPRDKHSDERLSQVKEKYERQLASLTSEFKQLKQLEKENSRMLKQQAQQTAEMERVKNEIVEMKRSKAELMRKLKEENKRIREIEATNKKRLIALEKAARQRDNEIIRLKRNEILQDEKLKRKNDDIKRLREQQKRENTKRENHTRYVFGGGSNKSQQQPSTQPLPLYMLNSGNESPVSARQRLSVTYVVGNNRNKDEVTACDMSVEARPRPAAVNSIDETDEAESEQQQQLLLPPPLILPISQRRAPRRSARHFPDMPHVQHQRNEIRYSPTRAKRHWNKLEKTLLRTISNRQNRYRAEEELEHRLNERSIILDKIEKVTEKEKMAIGRDLAMLECQRQTLIGNKNFVRNEINRLQNKIVEMDNYNTKGADDEKIAAIIQECHNIDEAKYLLCRLLDTVIDKGLRDSKVDYTTAMMGGKV